MRPRWILFFLIPLALLMVSCGQTPTSTASVGTAGDADGDGVTGADGDCDDSDARVHPGAAEVCDGLDNDCDGAADNGPDRDGDGAATCPAAGAEVDCDDADAGVYPGAEEIPYDGVDQDCDGVDLTDVDGDGYAAVEAGGRDCDDADSAVSPGAAEIPYDGLDQDCSGEDVTDADADGYDGEAAGGDDCDDTRATVHPGGEELLDGLDNDCDGLADRVDLSQAERVWIGEYEADRAGASAAVVGDVDGDGLLDLAIGAPAADGAAPGSGKVYLLLGRGLSGGGVVDLSYSDVTFVGLSAGEGAGASVAGVGDINGDGLDDLAITAPGPEEGREAGVTYLIFGSTAGWPGRVSLGDADGVLAGVGPGDTLGAITLAAGDVNGDGLDDLAIGAPGFDDPGLTADGPTLDRGAVAIFYGDVDRLWLTDLLSADQLWLGDGAGARAGASLAALGDITGDGRGELIIGAPGLEGEDGAPGGAFMLLGRAEARDLAPTLASADVRFTGGSDGDRAGAAVAGGRDLNGDGWPDFAVGAPGAAAGAGAVYVFFGKPSGLAVSITPQDADATWESLIPGAGAGAALALSPTAAGAALWVGMPGLPGPADADGLPTEGAAARLAPGIAGAGGDLEAASPVIFGLGEEGAGGVLGPVAFGDQGESGCILMGLPGDGRGGDEAGAVAWVRGP